MYLGYSDLWGFPYTDLRSPAAMLAPYRANTNEYKLTGRPAQDGLAQVDYSGRRFGALQRPFSDRAGTQNSDLGDYQLRQHLREACLTGVTAGSVVSLVGPLDVQ